MYVVPESKRSIAQNQFVFSTDGVNEFSIPKVQFLSLEFIENAAKQKHGIEFLNVCAELGQKDAVAALRKLDGEQIGALVLAWQESSAGITPGESLASTN